MTRTPLHPDDLNEEAVKAEVAGEPWRAAHLYDRAIELNPRHLPVHRNYVSLCLLQGWIDRAEQLVDSLLRLWPNDQVGLKARAYVLLEQARTQEALTFVMASHSYEDLLFYRLHVAGDVRCAHEFFGNQWPRHEPPASTWDGRRPIRVGYLCPESTTVYPFLLPALRNHTSAVEPLCYWDADDTHPYYPLVAKTSNHVFVRGAPDAQIAAWVRRDHVDVLVNLRNVRPGLFALAPAPVMCSWIGYPEPLGLPNVPLIDDTWCWEPKGDEPEVGELPFDRNGFVTFGHLGRSFKITREVAHRWAQILDGVPGSKLMVLSRGGEQNSGLRRTLVGDFKLPGDRLSLVPVGTRLQYLDHYANCDVALDTDPYNGTTTTCDGMWQGVPLVTFRGDTHRARIGVQLTAELTPDFVANGPDDYVRTAIDAGTNVSRLRETRRTFRDRVRSSRLFDGAAVAQSLEKTFAELLRAK